MSFWRYYLCEDESRHLIKTRGWDGYVFLEKDQRWEESPADYARAAELGPGVIEICQEEASAFLKALNIAWHMLNPEAWINDPDLHSEDFDEMDQELYRDILGGRRALSSIANEFIRRAYLAWLAGRPGRPAAARELAARVGAGRPGADEHQRHLAAVEAVLRQYGVEEVDLLAAAWMHDAIERREASEADIRSVGFELLWTVRAITTSPATTREKALALTYPRIGGGALTVKLADWIATVEARVGDTSPEPEQHRLEYPGFRAALRGRSSSEADGAMWHRLNELLLPGG